MDFKQDEVFSLENNGKDLSFRTCKYVGFQLVEAFYIDDNGEEQVDYAYVVGANKNVFMNTLDNGGGAIEVLSLDDEHYFLHSSMDALIFRIVSRKPYILASVSRNKPGEMYKLTDYLLEKNLIVLTNYLPEENRNLQYLYNFSSGKVVSSGYDSIEEKNGKIYASYGLATGFLDEEGNFILQGDEEDKKKPFFLTRLFRREKKSVGNFIR